MDQRENTTDGTMAIIAYWNGDYEMIHNHVTHKILFYNNIIIYYIKLLEKYNTGLTNLCKKNVATILY